MRRRYVQFHNPALVPASLLPFKDEWQHLADSLAPGDALLVIPATETPLKGSMRKVASTLRARGRTIATVSADRFG
jgi:hypothetical protein